MVASDPATSRQLRLRLASGTSWVSHLLQDMVEVTLGRPEVAKLLARAREDYVRRRQTLEDAAEQGRAVRRAGRRPQSGFRGRRRPGRRLALAHRGWLVRHGDAFGVQDPVRGLRVTISDINVAQSRELARDIRDSL